MPKAKKKRLPNELFELKNPDKLWHEVWYKHRNALNLPHPWRGVFLGPPNCGKGSTVKHILLRAKPQFEQVFCIHCDPDFTTEWNDVGAEMLDEIPAPEDWAGEVKTLVILDDLEFNGMSKEQKRRLDRLYGFVSTHKNISVALCAQDAFSVPTIVRRCSNLWCLWKISDMDAMACVARKTGMKKEEFKSIFNKLMPKTHDSLWLDMTSKSPYPRRKNGFDQIKKKDESDDDDE